MCFLCIFCALFQIDLGAKKRLRKIDLPDYLSGKECYFLKREKNGHFVCALLTNFEQNFLHPIPSLSCCKKARNFTSFSVFCLILYRKCKFILFFTNFSYYSMRKRAAVKLRLFVVQLRRIKFSLSERKNGICC